MKTLDVNKTYFITGGAGFIGFFLSKSLLEKGAKVIGFDNMNDYTAQSLVQTYNTDTRNYSNIIQRANKNINQLTYEIINQKSFKYYDVKRK